jgi:hypothetical protein
VHTGRRHGPPSWSEGRGNKKPGASAGRGSLTMHAVLRGPP